MDSKMPACDEAAEYSIMEAYRLDGKRYLVKCDCGKSHILILNWGEVDCDYGAHWSLKQMTDEETKTFKQELSDGTI